MSSILHYVKTLGNSNFLPSVLWRCWLGGRKGTRPFKNMSGGVLVWLSVWSNLQTCIWPSWCHCHSLSLASVKSRLVLPFWYWLSRVVPEKGPLNRCVCVCVCVCEIDIYHIYLPYSHLPVLWNVKKLLHTDSKHLHHCCHLSNKIENIDCRPDIPYTLQWAGRCPPQNCPFHWGVWAFTIVPLVSDVHIPNVISVGGAVVAQLTVMFNTQTERQTDHATAVTIGRILCMQSDVA